jgi:hypothetical protein
MVMKLSEAESLSVTNKIFVYSSYHDQKRILLFLMKSLIFLVCVQSGGNPTLSGTVFEPLLTELAFDMQGINR